MNRSLATTGLALTLAVALPASALAQIGGRTGSIFSGRGKDKGSNAPAQAPSFEASARAGTPRDPNVVKSGDAIPEPVDLDQIKVPNIPAPAEPIDAYLLQREHGPFMVLAHTFTGPEAAKYAQILAMELRRDYHMPAYVWLAKVQPMRSNIFGVQPTAPPHARNGDMSPPEKWRTTDEAAVLVGNCKTIDESKELWKQVKKIRPRCLDTFPTIYQNRKGKGLNRAFMVTNPFVPSQDIFPGGGPDPSALPIKQGQAFDPGVAVTAYEKVKKVDPLVKRMNEGPHSIFKNPGKYTLQVAEYSGRTAVTVTTEKGLDDKFPENRRVTEKSPLLTAGDDAERLADALNKCRSMKGMRAYVYHTRYSSFVTIGSYSGPNDPSFKALHAGNQIAEISNELLKRGFSQIALRPSAEPMEVPRAD